MYTSSTWHNMFLPFTAGWDRESSQWEVHHLGMIALLTRVGSVQVTKIRLDRLNGLSWSIANSIWGHWGLCALWITSRSNRLICKVTLSSPSLWASFHPLFPLSKDILFKSQYELLKLSILCTKFQSNYSNSIGRSSENIWSSSNGGCSGKKGTFVQRTAQHCFCCPTLVCWSLSIFGTVICTWGWHNSLKNWKS